jgi:hypothetical protein
MAYFFQIISDQHRDECRRNHFPLQERPDIRRRLRRHLFTRRQNPGDAFGRPEEHPASFEVDGSESASFRRFRRLPTSGVALPVQARDRAVRR